MIYLQVVGATVICAIGFSIVICAIFRFLDRRDVE
jgi:hypothetical protein